METRLKMEQVQPAAYRAMLGFEKYMSTTTLDPLHKELIKIRASQINGCAYCLSMHSKDARKLGETEQRIYVLSAWREAKNLFSIEEQVILSITEEITLIHKGGLSDELYAAAIKLFGEEKTAQIIMAVITINAWNRIGVGLKMEPEV
jgi:AhpD family alkylhydroperoxidase